ncbi:hypothetical protein LINPERHAP2_LOCUS29974 [Linum perenne]
MSRCALLFSTNSRLTVSEKSFVSGCLDVLCQISKSKLGKLGGGGGWAGAVVVAGLERWWRLGWSGDGGWAGAVRRLGWSGCGGWAGAVAATGLRWRRLGWREGKEAHSWEGNMNVGMKKVRVFYLLSSSHHFDNNKEPAFTLVFSSFQGQEMLGYVITMDVNLRAFIEKGVLI